MATTHDRNSTEATRAITTLRYFQVGVILGGGREAFAYKFMLIVGSQYFEQSREFSSTEVLIHIRDFFLQIRLIALGKTAHNEDLVYQSLLFLLDVFQNGVDTFFLGIIDKATGINNDYVSFVLMYYLLTTGLELPHKHLTIIYILRTA